MPVEVYGMAISGNVIPAVLLAKDLGVGDMVEMNIMNGEHMTEAALARNPFHQMPSMKDGDLCLAESNAILRYIAHKYDPSKYGDTIEKKALVDWALDWCSTNFYNNFKMIWYPVAGFGPPPEDQAAENAKAVENLNTFAGKFLVSTKFVGGETLTIADYKIAVWCWYLGQPVIKDKTGFELPERLKRYASEFMDNCPSKSFCDAGAAFLASKA